MGIIFARRAQWFELMLKSCIKAARMAYTCPFYNGGSSADDGPIYASEIDFARPGNEVPTVVMYAYSTVGLRIKRSDFDPPSVAAISSPLNCFVLEDLWANGGEFFFRERFCDWTVTSMRPSIEENIWSDESNKKSVNGRKLRNDRVVYLKTLRLNCYIVLVYTSYKCAYNFFGDQLIN